MKKNLLSDKFYIINIILCFFIFLTIIFFQIYSINQRHDFSIPYETEHINKIILDGRLPARLLSILFINILPSFFSINPNDYRSTIVNLVLAIVFMAFIIILVKSFFITENSNINIFKQKETTITIIPAFLSVLLPIGALHTNILSNYLLNNKELVVFWEYNFTIILYCFFFYFLFNLLIKNKKYPKIFYYLIAINSFLCGFWCEHLNVRIFIGLIIIFLCLFLHNKQMLKNKTVFIVTLLPFSIGMLMFFCFSDYFLSTETIAGKPVSNDSFVTFNSIKYLYPDFIRKYIFYSFVKDKYLYFIITILVLFSYYIKPNNYKNISYFCFSMLFSEFFVNFLYIFTVNITNEYIFERDSIVIFHSSTLIFIIFLLAGCLYFGTKKKSKIKYAINAFFLSAIIFFLYTLSLYGNNILKSSFEEKKSLLQMDKIVLVNNLLGDSALIPISFFYNDTSRCTRTLLFLDKYMDLSAEEYANRLENHYYSDYDTEYNMYFKKQYNQNTLGFIIVDNETAEKEYSKKLVILSKLIDDSKKLSYLDLNNKSLLFTPLKKYADITITNQDLERINNTINDDNIKDVILKAQAYRYYIEENFPIALKLYTKYLDKYPNDINALMITGDIYLKEEQYKEAIKIYKHLITIDSDNLYFLTQLLSLKYRTKEYNEIDELLKKIEIVNNQYLIYNNTYYLEAMKLKKDWELKKSKKTERNNNG